MLKSLLKDLTYIFCKPIGLVSKRNKASILMYHSVGDNGLFFTVKTSEFEKQLKFLKAKGYKCLKLSELLEKKNNGESLHKCVSITFDDGYVDNLEVALPLLEKYSIPATLFVVTGKYDSPLEQMSTEQLKKFASSSLVEVMPHTHTHRSLLELSFMDMSWEISNSRNLLEESLGIEANLFAPPKGKFHCGVVEYIKENNFEAMVTVEEGLVSNDTNNFELPRNAIDSATTFTQFKAKVSLAQEVYMSLKKKKTKLLHHINNFDLFLHGKSIGRVLFQEKVRENKKYVFGHVLDVAGGNSTYLNYFPKGVTVEKTNREGHSDVVLDFNKPFPYQDNTFDTVLCFNALYIADDPEFTLNEMMRVLRPGGRALLSTMLIVSEIPEPHDYERWTKEGFEKLFKRNGYTEFEVQRYGNRFSAAMYLLSPLVKFAPLRAVFFSIFLTVGRWIDRFDKQETPIGYIAIVKKAK